MWRKRNRPAPEQLIVPDDTAEAVVIREEAKAKLATIKEQAPLVRKMTDVMINRQGKNHYIELLYQHVPRGNA